MKVGNKIFARFPGYADIVKIRAKIPDNKNIVLQYRDAALDSSHNTSVTLSGTGEYKWYTLYNQSPNIDGKIQISGTAITEDCYIDSVIMQ